MGQAPRRRPEGPGPRGDQVGRPLPCCLCPSRMRYSPYPAVRPVRTAPRDPMRGLPAALLLGLALPANADPVSFRHEVMPVLSRAGCNSGACHGNLNGKGGFKLSLRGEDPAADLAALTRDMLA